MRSGEKRPRPKPGPNSAVASVDRESSLDSNVTIETGWPPSCTSSARSAPLKIVVCMAQMIRASSRSAVDATLAPSREARRSPSNVMMGGSSPAADMTEPNRLWQDGMISPSRTGFVYWVQ